MDDLFYNVTVSTTGVSHDLSNAVNTLTIDEESGKPDQLTLTISDRYRVYGHAIQSGMGIEVDLGTESDHSVVFSGQVYRIEGKFLSDGVPIVRIVAHDRSKLMGLRIRNRPWTNTNLSGIVTNIGREYFGSLGVVTDILGDPEFTGNGIRQTEETDLTFLLRLAQTYGCEMYVELADDLELLNFKSQRSIMSADPDVILYYGRCGVEHRLMSFNANSDISNIQRERQLGGMDYDLGEATEMSTTSVEEVGSTEDQFQAENLVALARDQPLQTASLAPLMAVSSMAPQELGQYIQTTSREAIPTFTSAANLQAVSQNQFSTRIHGMQGNGTMMGNHRVHAQASIDIADVGGQFSGIWYLSQVRHIVDNQGYRTEFECQR
ncbi:MAG: hypothetical protein CSB13_09215 [Chloroflexi bacterium]|nr:MAG: hypothetical protein CSB13_09215 [Chloroflexota bacterium]